MNKNSHNRIGLLLLVLCIVTTTNANAKLTPNKAAKQKWFAVNTPNFSVVSDGSKKKTIKFAQNLERFRAMFQLLGNYDLDSSMRPVKVYATKRAATYSFFLGDSTNLKNTSGFFADTINGNYAAIRLSGSSEKNQLSTLFHEYTHYLNSNLTVANSPHWYNEGVAEFLGQTEFKDDQVVLIGKPVQHHLININQMIWMPLETLLNATHIDSKDRRNRYKIYSQGWLLVHFFESTPKKSKQRKKFIQLLNEGVKPVAAIEQSTGLNIKEFERELRKHAKQRKHRYATLTFKSPLEVEDIEVRRLSSDELLYSLGEFALQAQGQYERARSYFEKALEVNPANVNALAGLANTYLGTDDEKTSKLIERAKSIDLKNVWVATVSGHFNSKKFREAENSEDEVKFWNLAVRDFNVALNSDTVNVEALYSAASLYASKGRYKKSLELTEYAFDVAPSNYTVRRSMIMQYLANGAEDKAEMIAEKVRRNHHMSAKSIEGFEKWYNKQIFEWQLFHSQNSAESSPLR